MGHADLPVVQPTEPSLTHVDALGVGSCLGDYELQGLLGVGGFGMVYRAKDRNLDRVVAIKEYMPTAIAYRQDERAVAVRSPTDVKAYAAGLAAFVAEARLLARFEHPSLAKVLHFWEANGTAYMVMPLYKGVTLKQARSFLDGPPPERWLRKVMWPILQALRQLHEHHVLHRDISPDNILLQDMGPPILLDLGSARKAVVDRTQRHTAVLKVNYAPIEQYDQGGAFREGAWTDIYALAAVVYSLVRNEPPQPATYRAVRDHMPSMVKVARTVRDHYGRHYSREFAVAIDRALRLDPADRPQTVTAFIDALHLKPPAEMASFDWWCEIDEPDAALAPARRWAFWRKRATAGRIEQQTRQTLNAWRKTGQHDSIWQDFDQSRGNTRAEPSTLESAWAPAVKRAPKLSRRFGARAGLAALLTAAVGGLLYLGQGREPAPAARSAAIGQEAVKPPVLTQPAPKPAAVAVQAAPKPVLVPQPAVAAARAPAQPSEVREAKPRPKPRPQPPPRPVAAAAKPAPKAPVRSQAAAVEPCADSNFFTRPMCLHQECKKPAFSQLAVCVETRAQEQANQRRARL